MVKKSKYNKAAASLIVVLFTTLLTVIITVSFVRVMVRDQQEASNNDLAQSAYDSAEAGIEDAKQALVIYKKCNSNTSWHDLHAPVCDKLQSAINSNNCNEALSAAGIKVGNTEGNIGGNQAYTCVKILTNTANYLGKINKDDQKVLPLSGESNFNSLTIEWFTRKDISGSNNSNYDLSQPSDANNNALPRQSVWAGNRPPMLRIQVGKLNSGSAALFLYPSSSNNYNNTNYADLSEDTSNIPRASMVSKEPIRINCHQSVDVAEYACKATIGLSNFSGGNSNGEYNEYLSIKSFYNATTFRVSLNNNGSNIRFNGSQPEIDSTGRAGNLFKRVIARVEYSNTLYPYPDAALDAKNNVCKNFRVTDSAGDYDNRCSTD